MSKLIRIMPTRDTAETVSITYEDTLRGRDPTGNFVKLINPRFPTTPVNSINDMIRTGAQGFIGSQESTPLQFQAATGFANTAEFKKININDYLIPATEDPLSNEYIDRGAGVGLNLVKNEINAERAEELLQLESLELDDFVARKVVNRKEFQPRNEVLPNSEIRIPDDRIQEKVNAVLNEVSDKLVKERSPETIEEGLKVLRRTSMIRYEDIGEQLMVTMEKDPALGMGKYLNNEKVQILLNIYEKLNNFGSDYLYNISPELKAQLVATAVLFDYFYNPGFSVTRGLVDLGFDIYNTGLNIYKGAKNMYSLLNNLLGGMMGFQDGDFDFNEKDIEKIKKVLEAEKKIGDEMKAEGSDTPLRDEIKDTLRSAEKLESEYRGTAFTGTPEEKFREEVAKKDLIIKLSKLYDDVKKYREGPLSRGGHLERIGALTPEANSQVPFGTNINERLTPAELKELRRRRKLQSKTIKEFYGEAPELNQSIEPAVTHNNNPTQGPIFDIPDSSPRQMQAAVLNPQDIINQMRASKQRKSKKVKQTSILGVERSTKESTKAETSRRV